MFISANVQIFYELTKLGSFSVFLYICPKMCNILFNEMKKRVLYILFMRLLSAVFVCLCSYNYMNAQPLWEGLSVDKFYRENKEIYLQRFENGIKYLEEKIMDYHKDKIL